MCTTGLEKVAAEVAMEGQVAASSRLVFSIIATIGWTMTLGPILAQISKLRDATVPVILSSLIQKFWTITQSKPV